MKIKILLGIIIAGFLTTCENSVNKKTIDYKNKAILDSLIRTTPHSTDTLFLGFTIGISKTDYENHILKLKKEGKTLHFFNSNRFSTYAGNFEAGPGYTFYTNISTEKSGKTLTGVGKYFLEPLYQKSGLMKLNILPIEEWNGDYGFDKPNWLEDKITENSEQLKDESLKQALIDNGYIGKYDFVRQKGNLIIYGNFLTINYIDLKTLLLEFLIKETEKEIIKEDIKDIKF